MENKTKHTAGPWEIRELEHINICGKLPGQGQQAIGRLQVATVTRLRGQEKANAALIAAAPELLALCKETLEAVDLDGNNRKGLRQALQAAIAKAEGK